MKPPELHHVAIDGRAIAYRQRKGGSPTLMFLPGYASDMDGSKADEVDEFAARHEIGCLRFDYSGTGFSEGDFATGTLGQWLGEAVTAIDRLTDGPLILVGSSMGGWIALHAALLRPLRVAGIVGISASPDFTQWAFDDGERQAIVRDGFLGPENHRVYRCFWESGQTLRLLEAEIGIDCPVRLVHGAEDIEVPIDIPLALMRVLRSADVQLLTIKNGGHRLSEPSQIGAILRAISGLLEQQS